MAPIRMFPSEVEVGNEKAVEVALSSAQPDEWGSLLEGMLGASLRPVSRDDRDGACTITSLLGMMGGSEVVDASQFKATSSSFGSASTPAASRCGGAALRSRIRRGIRAARPAATAEKPEEDERSLEDLLKDLGEDTSKDKSHKAKKKAPKVSSEEKPKDVASEAKAQQDKVAAMAKEAFFHTVSNKTEPEVVAAKKVEKSSMTNSNDSSNSKSNSNNNSNSNNVTSNNKCGNSNSNVASSKNSSSISSSNSSNTSSSNSSKSKNSSVNDSISNQSHTNNASATVTTKRLSTVPATKSAVQQTTRIAVPSKLAATARAATTATTATATATAAAAAAATATASTATLASTASAKATSKVTTPAKLAPWATMRTQAQAVPATISAITGGSTGTAKDNNDNNQVTAAIATVSAAAAVEIQKNSQIRIAAGDSDESSDDESMDSIALGVHRRKRSLSEGAEPKSGHFEENPRLPDAAILAGRPWHSTDPVQSSPSWHLQPSVGTWFCSSQTPTPSGARACFVNEGANEGPTSPSSTSNSVNTWHCRPSVGTWLQNPSPSYQQLGTEEGWPATPESTPPASPRQSFSSAGMEGQQLVWMPVPLHMVAEVQQFINSRVMG